MTTGTDEDALIEAVIRVRLAGESVADVHAKLSSEFPAATTGEVKKACSKATKRTGGVLPAADGVLEGVLTGELLLGELAAAAEGPTDLPPLPFDAGISIHMGDRGEDLSV